MFSVCFQYVFFHIFVSCERRPGCRPRSLRRFAWAAVRVTGRAVSVVTMSEPGPSTHYNEPSEEANRRIQKMKDIKSRVASKEVIAEADARKARVWDAICKPGVNVAQLARELNLNYKTVWNWHQKWKAGYSKVSDPRSPYAIPSWKQLCR